MEEYRPKYTYVYIHDAESAVLSIKADTEDEAEGVLGKLVFWFDDWALSEKEPIIYDEEILEMSNDEDSRNNKETGRREG